MAREHAIGQKVAQLRLRPAWHDELRDDVQVRARVDVVRDAGRDDREDVCGPLAADVERGEEPVASAEHQSPQLALAAVVGRLDVAVVEKEDEALPLAMEISEPGAERCLLRDDGALSVDPGPKLLENGRVCCCRRARRWSALSPASVERRSMANKRPMIRSPWSAIWSPERAASESSAHTRAIARGPAATRPS